MEKFEIRLGLAMLDTHIFKLNEYFVELNPANFKVLNRILNWIHHKKLFWIIFWIEFCRNIYIEFFVELNLDEANENESYIESIFWIFNWKGPFLVYFGHFLGTFLIQPVSMIPWLLNWIIYWIESPQFFLNWIIVWIEFWETNIESNIELNPFLPKFKLWIESFWVSIMANKGC